MTSVPFLRAYEPKKYVPIQRQLSFSFDKWIHDGYEVRQYFVIIFNSDEMRNTLFISLSTFQTSWFSKILCEFSFKSS